MYIKVPIIRRKKQIRVVFLLQEVGAWKTELLYLKMLTHPRFIPLIAISESNLHRCEKPLLMDYLDMKGYDYLDLDEDCTKLISSHFDFAFYYKPYYNTWKNNIYFSCNKRTIPLSIDYCISVSRCSVHLKQPLFFFSYYFFTDNIVTLREHKSFVGCKAHNVIPTGVPYQDLLLQDISKFKNPWKYNGERKRFIYAPHHSIPETNYGVAGRGIEYATILLFGEKILELASKYKDQITIAFKPHPALYKKLISFWGEEKTESYYDAWKNGENTQLETGDYIGLFKYSDAMIHDSSSFIAEYQYVDKPCLFLVRGNGEYVPESLNEFGRAAYQCHEVANCKEQIETFIKNVIDGVDEKHERRQALMNDYLKPPYGKSACENIINAILGVNVKTGSCGNS